MLPRNFLVKSILVGLKRNAGPEVSLELLASRIADQVEIAADVFESSDDPVAVPLSNVRQLIPKGPPPATPEDTGPEIPERKARAIENLPQPEVAGRSLIVAPDSAEGKKAMRSRQAVAPIRVNRPLASDRDGEVRQWEFQELYAEAIGDAPQTIEVTPHGSATSVILDRSFQADPAAGVIKILYTLAGQRDSAPSTPDSPQAVITIPIDVSVSFSVYSPRDIDIAGAVEGLKETAAGSFAPRPGAITSMTPRTGGSLENIYRTAVASTGGGRQQPSATSNFDNASVDLTRP